MSRPSYKTCHEVSANCPLAATTYGYYPILSVNAFFAAFFGVLLVTQLILGVRSRAWTYTLALVSGTLLEFMGYIGRLMMNKNPWSRHGFEMQICCLVLGPSFIAAAIYLTLKHMVLYCGPKFSLLKARLYPWVFIGCDFGSIVLQALGGGTAAAGSTKPDLKVVNAGNRLIVAGIAFQVATMAACGLLVFLYALRYRKGKNGPAVDSAEKSAYELYKSEGRSTGKLRIFAVAVSVAYVTILIRCIYRLPEMAGGWGNPLMRKETEFLLLDGMMIAIATLALTAFHPGFLFPPFQKFRAVKESEASTSE